MRRKLLTRGLTVALIGIVIVPSMGRAAGREPAAQRASTPTLTPAPNLLQNDGFEGTFTRQYSASNGEWVNGRVAEGWTAWWRRPTAPDGQYPVKCPADGDAACQPWQAPEYRETKGIPYDPPRIHGGDNSQMYFTSFGLHEGGVYQKVIGVQRGGRLQFSVWVRAWSNSTEDTARSAGQPSMHMRAGIDPNGGVDPWSKDVMWSKEFDAFDQFSLLSVEAVARSDTVTVFFRSAPERALKHIDIVLDDAELVALGPPPPTPVIIDSPNRAPGALPLSTASGSPKAVVHVMQPGDTLFAIAQRYGVDVGAIYALNGLNESSVLKVGQSILIPLPAAVAPTAAPTPTPSQPKATGTLCVGAFEDRDSSGRYHEGDDSLSGAEFIVVDAAGAKVAASNQAWCWADLPVGTYAVSAQMPAGYQPTTETRWAVALTQGARVDVTVGGRLMAEAASSAPDPSDVTPIAIGAGSIVLLIVATVWMRRGATRKAVQ